jgi:putative FmdB family regulatory protein
MPIYDFRCRDCGSVSEIFVRGMDVKGACCRECGGENLEKLISSSYMIKIGASNTGNTCCGRSERCETPPCSTGDTCTRE